MAGTGEFSLASNMSRNTTAYFETHHPMTSFTNVRSCRRFEGKGAMRWLFWVTPVMFVLGAVRYATHEEDTPSFLAAAFMVAIAGGLGLSLNVAALYRSTRRAEERAAAAAAAASAAAANSSCGTLLWYGSSPHLTARAYRVFIQRLPCSAVETRCRGWRRRHRCRRNGGGQVPSARSLTPRQDISFPLTRASRRLVLAAHVGIDVSQKDEAMKEWLVKTRSNRRKLTLRVRAADSVSYRSAL